MKLTITALLLREAATSAIAKRGTIPLLEHMLLEAEGDTLRVISSDYEKWLVMEVPADIEEPGKETCNPALLKSALQGLQGEVLLESGKGCVNLQQEDRHYRFDSLGHENYERPMEGEWRIPRGLSVDDLANAIETTEYAMSRKDARHFLESLALLPYAVAGCDGHRVAIADQYNHGFEGYDLLIPAATVPLFDKLLKQRGEETKTAFNCLLDKDRARAVRLQVGNTTIISKLVDSQYPDIRRFQANPDELENQLTVDGGKLLAALNRLMPFAYVQAGGYWRINLKAKEGSLQLEVPGSSETLECHCQGKFDLFLNPSYLRDVAKLAGESGPMTISADSDARSTVYVTFPSQAGIHCIMPMN